MSEHRIVWILGAGFSQPLGGPMLGDLLSLESREDLADAHKIEKNDPVHLLYHYGRKFKDGWFGGTSPSGENLWENAEDFLDKLDTALLPSADEGSAKQSPIAARLNAILDQWIGLEPEESRKVNGRLQTTRRLALRYVAAECGEFIRRSSPKTEQWEPQTDWLINLEPSDVVITFNYDRVIETIDEQINAETGKNVCNIVRNRRDWGNAQHARVLKLHGSVDWRWGKGSIERADADYAEKAEDPATVVLATPGPSKRKAVQKRLGHLWEFAREALKAADCIVFVGYRFPFTDAYARKELLGAISGNQVPDLELHVVLGSERNSDVIRLEHLLTSAVNRDFERKAPEECYGGNRSFRLYTHPLRSQDFFSVTPRVMLTRTIGRGRERE